MADEDLRQLVERNLELTEKLAKDMKKIRHHFWMASVWSVIKMSIFLAPLVGAYYFLQPYVGTFQSVYEQALGLQKTAQGLQQNIGELKSAVKSVQGAGMALPSLPSLEALIGK